MNILFFLSQRIIPTPPQFQVGGIKVPPPLEGNVVAEILYQQLAVIANRFQTSQILHPGRLRREVDIKSSNELVPAILQRNNAIRRIRFILPRVNWYMFVPFKIRLGLPGYSGSGNDEMQSGCIAPKPP